MKRILSFILAIAVVLFACVACMATGNPAPAPVDAASVAMLLPFLFGTTNTLITPQIVAQEALVRLLSNKVMSGLVHTDFAKEFKQIGDTVTVRRPAVFTANEFTTDIVAQNVTEGSVAVKLDKIADVSVEITAKELSLDLPDFGVQVLDGMVQALTDKIDQDLCGLYIDVPYFAGVSGAPADSLEDVALGMLVLNNNKCPVSNRRFVMNPTSQSKLVTIAALANAEKSGSTDALREASIGRLLGMDSFMSQNIKVHTAGVVPTATTPKVNAQAVVGATSIAIKGCTGATDRIEKGDILQIGAYQYVATAGVAAVSNVATVAIYPALKAQIEVDDAVVFPDKTAKAHVANLMFNKNAFAFVNRPLALPLGATSASAYVAMAEGIAVRCVMSYDAQHKMNLMSLDTLYGVKTLYPELAVRLLG
jgi:hypothetical protein